MPARTPPSPLDAALKLLAGRDYSRSEMLAKLRSRGYDEAAISAALDTLEKYNYVKTTGADRAQLAAMAAEYLRKRKGDPASPSAFRALEGFLLRKGFDENLVREYLERLAESLEGRRPR